MDAASGAQNNLSPATIFVRLEKLGEGVQAVSSDSDSSAGIRKLNDLDQMRDNKQISDEEYTRARIAIIQKYFPEMIPKPEDLDAADTPTPDPDP